jgi:di/tricarboxylate transporter
MPDPNMMLVGVIVVAAMAFFIWGKFRIDGVAICVLVALFVFGLITPEQTVAGFTSQATITIAAMFVISTGLVRTGLVEWAARHIDRLAGKTEMRLIMVIALTAAALSAFLINTAVVAIFIPVAMVLARSRKTAPSRVLMPLSFASQFGGVCTLIGTSTNLIVNSIGVERGLAPFGFFEFLPLGLAMTGAGMVYLATVGRILLPVRKAEEEQVDRFRLADYLAQAEVQEKSPLVGQTWERAKLKKETQVELTNLFRAGKAVSRPRRTVTRPGDVLLLHGNIEQILQMESRFGLKIMKEARVKDQELRSHDMKLTEVVIPPGSNLIGRTIEKAAFFHRHGLSILAIQRRNRTLRESLADINLKENDTVLLLGHKDDLVHIMNSPNVIVTNELTELYLRKDRAIMAVAALSLVVILSTLSILPIMLAAIIGAVAMVVTRCLTVEEAYRAIDWKIIFLLGGMIPLGLALEQSGAAAWMVNNLLQPVAGNGPVVVLALLYILTAVLTEVMSNVATAAILAPVAFTAAVAANIDPRPFLVAITFAASTSFTTPIGYQTNTMIYAPGGYRFTDFFRVGLPLNVVFFVLSVLLIPLIWPF